MPKRLQHASSCSASLVLAASVVLAFACSKTTAPREAVHAADAGSVDVPALDELPPNAELHCQERCTEEHPASSSLRTDQCLNRATIQDCTRECTTNLRGAAPACEACILDQLGWYVGRVGCGSLECSCEGLVGPDVPSFATCELECAASAARQGALRLAEPTPSNRGRAPDWAWEAPAPSGDVSSIAAASDTLWMVHGDGTSATRYLSVAPDIGAATTRVLQSAARAEHVIVDPASQRVFVTIEDSTRPGAVVEVCNFAGEAVSTLSLKDRFAPYVTGTALTGQALSPVVLANRSGEFGVPGQPPSTVFRYSENRSFYSTASAVRAEGAHITFAMVHSLDATNMLTVLDLDATSLLTTPRFTRTLYGAEDQHVTALTIDASGNFVVAGMNGGVDPLGYFIAKLDAKGEPLWVASEYDDPLQNPTLRKLTTDSRGNVYVTGSEHPEAYAESENDRSRCSIYGCESMFVAKYSSSGDLLYVYAHRSTHSEGTAITVDATDHAFVAGTVYREKPTMMVLRFDP